MNATTLKRIREILESGECEHPLKAWEKLGCGYQTWKEWQKLGQSILDEERHPVNRREKCCVQLVKMLDDAIEALFKDTDIEFFSKGLKGGDVVEEQYFDKEGNLTHSKKKILPPDRNGLLKYLALRFPEKFKKTQEVQNKHSFEGPLQIHFGSPDPEIDEKINEAKEKFQKVKEEC